MTADAALDRSSLAGWRARAACRGLDATLFVGPDRDDAEPDADRAEREDRARRICAGCAVTDECADYATRLGTVLPDGIWGGLNRTERDRVRRTERERRRVRGAARQTTHQGGPS